MAQNDELLFRQMPHSLEAEQAALGAMPIDADCIKDVMDKLQPEDFYIKQNRDVFETIYTMFSFSKPIDGVTVAEEMQKNGTYDDQTTRSYLVQLMEITPTSANVMEYVAIIRDKALLRGLAKAAGEIRPDIDSEVLAYTLMGASNFLGLNWGLFQDYPTDTEKVVESFMQIIGAGIFTQPDEAPQTASLSSAISIEVEFDDDTLEEDGEEEAPDSQPEE